jgi:hypothetical protein
MKVISRPGFNEKLYDVQRKLQGSRNNDSLECENEVGLTIDEISVLGLIPACDVQRRDIGGPSSLEIAVIRFPMYQKSLEHSCDVQQAELQVALRIHAFRSSISQK